VPALEAEVVDVGAGSLQRDGVGLVVHSRAADVGGV